MLILWTGFATKIWNPLKLINQSLTGAQAPTIIMRKFYQVLRKTPNHYAPHTTTHLWAGNSLSKAIDFTLTTVLSNKGKNDYCIISITYGLQNTTTTEAILHFEDSHCGMTSINHCEDFLEYFELVDRLTNKTEKLYYYE